jgi:serine/threonine protein phosphatase PrpC
MIEETTDPRDLGDVDNTIPQPVMTSELLGWESFGMTDPGKVRRVNEDALWVDNRNRLWVVADGMGGHYAGDIASQSIAEAFAALDTTDRLSETANRIEVTLIDLNRRFLDLASRGGDDVTIGSTVAVCAFRQGWMLLAWVGDSRIFRWREGTLHQLTQDHSQVEELISHGLLLRENVEAHPAAHVVTRAIGAADDVFVDLDYCDARPGDRFLLCSDGLTREVTTPEIRRLLGQEASAQQMCEGLIAATLAAGARDNVTAIVAKAHAAKTP